MKVVFEIISQMDNQLHWWCE